MGRAPSGRSIWLCDVRDPSGAELLIFARTLMLVSGNRRSLVAARILHEVEIADQHVRLLGHCDPAFGDGSLMSRCHLLSPLPEPLAHDHEFLLATIAACEALLRHSGR